MKTILLTTGTSLSLLFAFNSCTPPATPTAPTPSKPNVEQASIKTLIPSAEIIADVPATIEKEVVVKTQKAKVTAEAVTESVKDTVVPAPIAEQIAPERKALKLIVKNLKSSTAPIVVGVYGPHNKFLDENDQMKVYKFTPHDNELQTEIQDLDYGEFAFALYQDVDNDGKMTKNLVGMPQEPYAFSNNYKPVIRAPKFKECEFTFNASTNTVVVSMIK